jgi:hypothetical protein
MGDNWFNPSIAHLANISGFDRDSIDSAPTLASLAAVAEARG